MLYPIKVQKHVFFVKKMFKLHLCCKKTFNPENKIRFSKESSFLSDKKNPIQLSVVLTQLSLSLPREVAPISFSGIRLQSEAS